MLTLQRGLPTPGLTLACPAPKARLPSMSTAVSPTLSFLAMVNEEDEDDGDDDDVDDDDG